MNLMQCPVCTLYLREGISLKDHLDTHPKDKVIEALVSSSEQKSAAPILTPQPTPQPTFIQQPYNLGNHVPSPVQFSILQPNEQLQNTQAVFMPQVISNRRFIVHQPGELIKIPQRQGTKMYTTLPPALCSQIIQTPQYASSQSMGLPPSISAHQSINTHATTPTIIYSQMPTSVQELHTMQNQIHSFTQEFTAESNVPPANSIITSQTSSVSCTSLTTNETQTSSIVNSVVQEPRPSIRTESTQSDVLVQATHPEKVSSEEAVSGKEKPCESRTHFPDLNIPSARENTDSQESCEVYSSNEASTDMVEKDTEREDDEYDYFDETERYDEDPIHRHPDMQMKEDLYTFDEVELKDELVYDMAEDVDDYIEEKKTECMDENSLSGGQLIVPDKDNVYSSQYGVYEVAADEMDDSQDVYFEEDFDGKSQSDCEILKGNNKESEVLNFKDDIMCFEDMGDIGSQIQEGLTEQNHSEGVEQNCFSSTKQKNLDIIEKTNFSPAKTQSELSCQMEKEQSCSKLKNNKESQHTKIEVAVHTREKSPRNENQKRVIEFHSKTNSPTVQTKSSESSTLPNKIKFRLDAPKKRKLHWQPVDITVHEEPTSKKQKVYEHPHRTLLPEVDIIKVEAKSEVKDTIVPKTEDNVVEISHVVHKIRGFGDSIINVHNLVSAEVKPDITDLKSEILSDNKPSSSRDMRCENKALNMSINSIEVLKQETLPTEVDCSDTRESSKSASVQEFYNSDIEIVRVNTHQWNSRDKPQKKTSLSPLKSVPTVIQHYPKCEPPPYSVATRNTISRSCASVYTQSSYCEPSSSKVSTSFSGIDLSAKSEVQMDSRFSHAVGSKTMTSAEQQTPLHDFTDIMSTSKIDRLPSVSHGMDYDSVDTPQWLFRGLNVLPPVIEEDRMSCASPKTLLNLDHQTSFQTFEPEDSGSTSINMQTDELMPPRGELSGQESLESSAWGYQEEHATPSYKQWEDEENEPSTHNFRTKIEKEEPLDIESQLNVKIKMEYPVNSGPSTSSTKKKHACIYCDKVFLGWKSRRNHMQTSHPEFFNEPETSKLLTHTKIEIDQTEPIVSVENLEASSSVIICASCPMKFDNIKSYDDHITEAHKPELDLFPKPRQRQCTTCLQTFDKLKPYQEHIRFVHPLECPVCQKTFLTKPNLSIHMRTHLKIKPYRCDVCEKSFVTAQKLSDHKNTHTGNTPFPCNLCDRSFKRYSNLAQHKKVIHLKKKKTKDFYCHCGEIFQSKGKLKWHQETHANVPKQCSFCVEKFQHTASLTRHIRKNHDPFYLPDDRQEAGENTTCSVCNMVVLKSTLKSHMRVHAAAKPFACTVCKKSFNTKWNLGLHQWTHVSRTHMPFKCKSCNRGFYSKSEYQAHLRSHKNIRPYTCNYCGRKFIRKFNCIRHVREHEASKKYTCNLCGKTFHRSYYLTAHVRVHNGERPFSCHICGKTSTTKSNHNKHVKTHHARESINTEG